jgi:SAM-dependent methyltransferase
MIAPAGARRLAPPCWDHQWYPLRSLARALDEAARKRLPALRGGVVVDLGCGDSPYQSLLTQHGGANYIRCDLGNMADVAIVPGQPVDLPTASADLVVSFQVLEHVWDLDWYLGEARRLLKPSGQLLLTTHGSWLYHPHPGDFRRWTRTGLTQELAVRGLDVEHCQGLIGPLAWTTQFRLLGLREALRRVPLVGAAVVPPVACLMNLRMSLEDAITPADITADNACIYLTISRPCPTGGTP